MRAPGFADPPRDSARVFRAAMEAMARPGTAYAVTGPEVPGLSPAAAVLLLTLTDPSTPVYLGRAAARARDWLTFHTGAPAAEKSAAMFALGAWEDLAPLDPYPVGTPDYPDRSATLIVETSALRGGDARLTGPGIETEARLPLPDRAAFARNAGLYPLGLDFYFTCGSALAALPRSTAVEAR
ncbi:phosphonate C-P lyase system protein PhnH [Histidinibacterium lentulum]|uniref:Phosphonate C-P lyase system protein PhnH n=1 Tax=Histidinibacterium lentulum TaxID=2480588 RepID=A0A3N2R4V1_9RHOB|nr:phosphonate C-P lyase system protein PhnH [Histidinibacterium lentulum]ROU02437.1 phosphonate C-P lyase system protein PhnH [Histidinibacterium lentulum]